MKLALVLAVLPALLAPQDTAERWTPVGSRQGSKGEVTIEVAPASIRKDGAQRHFRMRATSKFSGRIVISNIVADCAANQYWGEGEMQLYVDGKLADTRILSGDDLVHRDGNDEPVSTAMIKLVCAA